MRAEIVKRHSQRPSQLLLAAASIDERIERALADARRADARLLAERLKVEAAMLSHARQAAEVEVLGARVLACRELQAT